MFHAFLICGIIAQFHGLQIPWMSMPVPHCICPTTWFSYYPQDGIVVSKVAFVVAESRTAL
jgi:hypothetical protein